MSLLSANDTRSFIFPRIENEALGLYLYHPGKAWTNGPFGLKEPDTETWERVSPSLIDMAIVPGLAFDKAGGRLGRGRGFYDRLLAHPGFRGIKIGLCWEWQLLPLVPCEASDARMNQVIHSGK